MVLIVILLQVLSISAQTVYVNNFNNKYHINDCPKVNTKYFAIDLKEALNNDYNACNVCNPPTKLNPQNVDTSINNDRPLLYTEVIKVDSNIFKNILFERARAWLNDKFRNYKEVSQIQDKESGELSIKGILFTHYLNSMAGSGAYCNVRFKLSIWVKDGRYKYEFTDYNDECFVASGSYYSLGILTNREVFKEKGFAKKYLNDLWIEVKYQTDKETNEMISSLKAEMSKSKIVKDEW